MLRIIVFQFDPQCRDPEQNIMYIAERTGRYSDALIVLPEFSFSSYIDYEFIPFTKVGNFLDPLRRLNREKALSFVGSMPVQSNGRKYNRGFYLTDNAIQFKDKHNLFGAEQQIMGPGHSNQLFTYTHISFSLQICLDIANPVRSYKAVATGARFIVNPATVSVDYLRTINKARALENKVPTIFCNRNGAEEDGTRYLGCSAIFLPDGEEHTVDEKSGIISFTL